MRKRVQLFNLEAVKEQIEKAVQARVGKGSDAVKKRKSRPHDGQ